jgi:hypothetical protein
MCTDTVGCARVGELSVAAAASVWNAHETPADETPFHVFVLTVTCLAMLRNGLSLPCAVRMMLGSMKRSVTSQRMLSGLVISASLSTSP